MKNKARLIMYATVIVSLILTVLCSLLYRTYRNNIFFSLVLTFGTVFFQFTMRLLVGLAVNILFKKPLDYNHFWFEEKPFEKKLYKLLKVKKWKTIIPAFRPESFNIKANSMQAIVQNMCIAELGHEIMIAASYLSLFFSLMTNNWKIYIWIFVGTSSIAACFDFLLVIQQRFNRPRILAFMKRTENKSL